MRVSRIQTLAGICLLSWISSVESVSALERLEPTNGCYFGFNFGTNDSLDRLTARLELTPAVFVQFYEFPFPNGVQGDVVSYLSRVRDLGGIALITLEPMQGLEVVNQADCISLGDLCADYEAQGIDGIMVRFAHEMNGSWYPWGQQPILYVEKYRLLAQEVRSRTTRTALLWAPNYGMGYPFSTSSPFSAQPATPDYAALDTNGDEDLTHEDDMYEPYYPGDDVVDWVGMTLYHWGISYPWFENELPLPNSFALALTGNNGLLPNFYGAYSADGVRNKPLVIPETSAFYNTQQPGANEFAIKQAWWQQVFNISGDRPDALDVAQHFPKLKCVNWFDHYKPEGEAQHQWVDWRISMAPEILHAFLQDVRKHRNGQSYFMTAPEMQRDLKPNAILPLSLPNILPLAGEIGVQFQVKASTNCDLVIDLLDQNYQWMGGTRIAVTTGTQDYQAGFSVVQQLVDGQSYRWSIFLTPAESNYLGAFAWHKGPLPIARAVTPEVSVVCAPPIWLEGSNVTARIQYTALSNAHLHVNLLNSEGIWQTGQTVSLPLVNGTVDVALPGRAELTNGSYFLEALLSTSPTNMEPLLARSTHMPITLAGAASQDFVEAKPEPSAFVAGENVRVIVSYTTLTTRDLHVELLDANSNLLVEAIQDLPAGTGVRTITLSHPSATPGCYRVQSYLTETGQTNLVGLANSDPISIEIFSQEYRQWIETHWGRILNFDQTHPSQDADSDLAVNQNEQLALTNPRDPDSILKANIGVVGGNFRVQWPSVVGRAYRVVTTANLNETNWTAMSELQAGTGEILETTAGPVGANRFFRVLCQPVP